MYDIFFRFCTDLGTKLCILCCTEILTVYVMMTIDCHCK